MGKIIKFIIKSKIKNNDPYIAKNQTTLQVLGKELMDIDDLLDQHFKNAKCKQKSSS